MGATEPKLDERYIRRLKINWEKQNKTKKEQKTPNQTKQKNQQQQKTQTKQKNYSLFQTEIKTR